MDKKTPYSSNIVLTAVKLIFDFVY